MNKQTFDQANVKDDEAFQPTKSNEVDQYFTTLLQHVGVVSGLSEGPSLSVYYWHSPVHYREQLMIIGPDGLDSPKTRHRRRLWREGMSVQIAVRITQITLIVCRSRRCLL